MYLLNFINSHSNWEKLLAAAPYNLEIKYDGAYFLLKYDQILSDFSLPEVKEARGPIFRFDEQKNQYICVCRSLDKFHNFSEPFAATNQIDWSKGVDVQEKVDGSIIRVFYDKGSWHVSTNGTIDAFKAECGDSTYGNVFYNIIEKNTTVRAFFDTLCPFFTYWFELVSPMYNHIVVKYPEDRIYYLGCRDMETMDEVNAPKPAEWLWEPKHFTYHSLEECIAAAHQMGEDEEGYVCVSLTKEDGSYLRIKVKGDVYLALHKIRGNGFPTLRRICEMWQNNTLDDFIAICPEYKSFIDDFTVAIGELVLELYTAHAETIQLNTRAEIAHELFELGFSPVARAYVFSLLDNHCVDSIDYLKKMRPRALSEVLQQYMHHAEIQTVKEDL